MINIFTVSFFGHRAEKIGYEAQMRIERLIHTLLNEKEYVEFLVGRDGEFDQMISSTVKREKRTFRADNSALIWILPYPTANLQNNAEHYGAYYDEIEICNEAANGFPKRAFQTRNRKMVDRSDLVVFYVNRAEGGAYQTMRYAQKQGKNIMNIAEGTEKQQLL